MQINAGQLEREIRCRIAIHIGLHEGISAALVPSHAVCNDAAVLTRECKCLVAALGGVRDNACNINLGRTMNEILYDIKRGGRAVSEGGIDKLVGSRATGQDIRSKPAD